MGCHAVTHLTKLYSALVHKYVAYISGAKEGGSRSLFQGTCLSISLGICLTEHTNAHVWVCAQVIGYQAWPQYMLKHVPKHLFRHVLAKHMPGHVPKHLLERMKQDV